MGKKCSSEAHRRGSGPLSPPAEGSDQLLGRASSSARVLPGRELRVSGKEGTGSPGGGPSPGPSGGGNGSRSWEGGSWWKLTGGGGGKGEAGLAPGGRRGLALGPKGCRRSWRGVPGADLPGIFGTFPVSAQGPGLHGLVSARADPCPVQLVLSQLWAHCPVLCFSGPGAEVQLGPLLSLGGKVRGPNCTASGC